MDAFFFQSEFLHDMTGSKRTSFTYKLVVKTMKFLPRTGDFEISGQVFHDLY